MPTKFDLVADIEKILGRPTARLWAAEKATLEAILNRLQTMHPDDYRRLNPETDEIVAAMRDRVLNGRDHGGFVEAMAARDYGSALSRADGRNRARFSALIAYREMMLPAIAVAYEYGGESPKPHRFRGIGSIMAES